MTQGKVPELLVGACTRCGGSAKYDGVDVGYRCMMCARTVLPVAFDMDLLDEAAANEAA